MVKKTQRKPRPQPSDEMFVLQQLLKALIAAYPQDYKGRSGANRLNVAVSAVTGLPNPSERPSSDDEELLKLIAFDWSVVQEERRNDVTLTEVIRSLVQHHPKYRDAAHRESIVRRLERRFKAELAVYMAAHSFDGAGGLSERTAASNLPEILRVLGEVGIPVDQGSPHALTPFGEYRRSLPRKF
jgi:hypothetical protein